MNALLISIAIATLGIDVGWQRLPEGGMLYIIQLDSQTLEALRAGQPIESDIPTGAGEVRSYRIVVGKAKLPRDIPPFRPTMQEKAAPDTTAAKGPALLVPPSLGPAQGVKPSTGQPAVFVEPQAKPPAANPQPPAATKPASNEPAKPWLPLILTVIVLFASVAANAYLGWITVELRRRCRAMILSQHSAASQA
jgi:hypothetical protein